MLPEILGPSGASDLFGCFWERECAQSPWAHPGDLLHLPESLPLPFPDRSAPQSWDSQLSLQARSGQILSTCTSPFAGQAPPWYRRLGPASVLNCPSPSEPVIISSLPKAPYHHPLFLPCPHFCLTIPVDWGLPFHKALLQPRFQPDLQHHLVPTKDNQLPRKNKRGSKTQRTTNF